MGLLQSIALPWQVDSGAASANLARALKTMVNYGLHVCKIRVSRGVEIRAGAQVNCMKKHSGIDGEEPLSCQRGAAALYICPWSLLLNPYGKKGFLVLLEQYYPTPYTILQSCYAQGEGAYAECLVSV